MSMFKKAKVVMLPTNQKATIGSITLGKNTKKLVILSDEELLNTFNNSIDKTLSLQDLYIISNDEIKEGDWVVYENKMIYQNNYGEISSVIGDEDSIRKYCKKIIATTDESLYYKDSSKNPKQYMGSYISMTFGENLPQPSQQFIEKYIEEYNKGNVITDVLVEYENIYIDSFGTTIIQHEKDSDSYLKQCTFVNSKLKINPKNNTITIKKLQETYNKKELCQILEKYTSFLWSEVGIHYPISLGNAAKDKFINSEL